MQKIISGPGGWNQLNKKLTKMNPANIFILGDTGSLRYCLTHTVKMSPMLKNSKILSVPEGEKNKNIITCIKLWKDLLKFHAGKDSLIICIGGGMILDIGGFVASTYKRGIDFIFIPTTLLAQTDAGLGGKNGINIGAVKNQIGLINQPSLTIIDQTFIKTNPEIELLSGFAETIKHALICDIQFWNKIKKAPPLKILGDQSIIPHSSKIKLKVISQDIFESNVRKTLNFGHTIGHALETIHKGTIPHGIAIAAGIIAEAYISVHHCGLELKHFNEIINYITRHYPAILIKKNSEKKILSMMEHDKKNVSGKINFSLLMAPGVCVYDQYPGVELIIASLKFYQEITK